MTELYVELPDTPRKVGLVRPRISSRQLLDLLHPVIEAERRTRREALLRQAEERAEREISKAFDAQGRAFLRRLRTIADQWPDTPGSGAPPWEPIFQEAARETRQAFIAALRRLYEVALDLGVRSTVSDLGMELVEAERALKLGELAMSWSITDPDAAAFLATRGGEQVTRVDDSTRRGIGKIVQQGVESGSSYNDTARTIQRQYDGFTGRLPPGNMPLPTALPPGIRSRAHIVAVQEAAMAYSEGQMLTGRRLENAGIKMLKTWLTAGDGRVDGDCSSNEAVGAIPFHASFPTGAGAPPQHVSCRCDLILEPDAKALGIPGYDFSTPRGALSPPGLDFVPSRPAGDGELD